MSTADLQQLHREAADLAWLVGMASDLADKADREGDMGDVTRVAVLLRAIQRSALAHSAALGSVSRQEGAAGAAERTATTTTPREG